MAQEEMDLTQISPERFAELVAGSTDEQIETTIRGIGTEQVLDRIFDGMQERFRPDRGRGQDVQIEWVVRDEGAEHTFTVAIKDETCEVRKAPADRAKVTLTAELVPFVRLVTGQKSGPQLFMTGKLRVAGDLMFAQRVNDFFDQPNA